MKRCHGFGVKFNDTDEICQGCDDFLECLETFSNDQIGITNMRNGGQKLPILKALKPKNNAPPVTIMIPKTKGNKVSIEFFFDKEWLRKQVFGDKDNVKKED